MNWYTDTGATYHITSKLDKLSTKEKYLGHDKIQTTSGSGMRINYIGNSTLQTPTRNLHLNKILHVPSTQKNLLSIHKLTTDNPIFIKYHSRYFLVKDQATRKILLRGKCRGGLYPWPSLEWSPSKCVFMVTRPYAARWHDRLGHPSMVVISKVVKENNPPCSSLEYNKEAICDACQQGKSHQLSFPKLFSVSQAPLELVHSDVWGPAPTSVGRKSYYVCFVDDFSKYSWVYLIRHKSEVFQNFHTFQKLVKRTFNRKILSMQNDWGGEYQKLNTFFTQIGISHQVSCPHTHQQNGVVECKHGHIVEVGLSLLTHAHMPLKY
jgi:hypothetical protein